jgi:outer membrane protein assembly factor BamB
LFFFAFNKKTGETVWQHDEKAGSWVTPTVVKVEGRDQLLYCADFKFRSVDPKDGKPLWTCDGLTIYVYTSPLYSPKHNIAIAMSGFNGAGLAVKLGGSGDITKDRLWLHPKNAQRVGSGVIVGDHVYILEESGVPHCYELATGKEVWKVAKRPTTLNWGSMVLADGKIYVMARDGTTFIFDASPKYQLLATNRLAAGETTNSSPVISNGEIFLRTNQHLWCVGAKK